MSYIFRRTSKFKSRLSLTLFDEVINPLALICQKEVYFVTKKKKKKKILKHENNVKTSLSIQTLT